MFAGCGDNLAVIDAQDAATPFVCDQTFRRDSGDCLCCAAAQVFVSRDSQRLVPTQSEIDLYFERWSRAVAAEPILRGRNPQDYRLRPPSVLDLGTLNPSAIEAWQRLVVVTGDTALDAIIGQLGVTDVNAFHTNPGGPGAPVIFSLTSTITRNEEILASGLAPTGTSLPDPFVAPQDDGEWTWIGSGSDRTAQIEFTFGWGDCFVACDGFHRLRALVPSEGNAVVYDLGGDPLPPYLALSPNTLPP
jgi:hypothetical protein